MRQPCVYTKLVAGALISLLLVVLLMSCTGSRGETPSPSPVTVSSATTTSPPPSSSISTTTTVTTTTTVVTTVVSPTRKPSPSKTRVPLVVDEITLDAALPDTFTTFTDPNGVFAISYPQDWIIPKNEWFDADNASRIVIDYYESGTIPRGIGNSVVFSLSASRPPASPYPAVNMFFFVGRPPPLPTVIERTPGEKIPWSYYHSLIDGKEAIIRESLGYNPDAGYFGVMMIEIQLERSHFRIECWAMPDEYYSWRDTFLRIAASFKLLKDY